MEVREQLEEYVASSFHSVGSGVKLRSAGSAANALSIAHHLAGPRRLLTTPGNLATCHCHFVLLPRQSVPVGSQRVDFKARCDSVPVILVLEAKARGCRSRLPWAAD